MTDDLMRVRGDIAALLDKASRLFKADMKLTFIAAHPTDEGRYLVMTNDDLEHAIEVLRRQHAMTIQKDR